SVPIKGDRLTLEPVRQFGLARTDGAVRDGVGEPDQEDTRRLVAQAVSYRRDPAGRIERQRPDLAKPQDAAGKTSRQRRAARPENPRIGYLEDTRTGSRGGMPGRCAQASDVPA